MFGNIDRILFPDECPVLEIEPGTQYVYPIFKNGSSSLFSEKKFRRLDLDEISRLSVVDVFVRDPHERFLSGVQTYLEKVPAWLDRKTMLFMIEEYLYLNRHFCPQIYWLLNLARFTTAKFRIRKLSELKTITNRHQNKSSMDKDIVDFFQHSVRVKFFNEMDEVLTINCIDKTVTMREILAVLARNYGTLYQDAFSVGKTVTNVLP